MAQGAQRRLLWSAHSTVAAMAEQERSEAEVSSDDERWSDTADDADVDTALKPLTAMDDDSEDDFSDANWMSFLQLRQTPESKYYLWMFKKRRTTDLGDIWDGPDEAEIAEMSESILQGWHRWDFEMKFARGCNLDDPAHLQLCLQDPDFRKEWVHNLAPEFSRGRTPLG